MTKQLKMDSETCAVWKSLKMVYTDCFSLLDCIVVFKDHWRSGHYLVRNSVISAILHLVGHLWMSALLYADWYMETFQS